MCSRRKVCSEFFNQLLSIFVHISGSIVPKVMTLEVEERPRLSWLVTTPA